MTSEADDDRALVQRANRGDADAFEALYRRHRHWVAALARRFTGSRDDALDVLQETFAHFFGRFPGFVLTASVRGYLYPVVRHTSLTLLRKRRRLVPLEPSAEPLLEAPALPDTSRDEFERLVGELPEGQRELLRLRFVLELRLEEIAEALDVPLGTVKSRLHNALKTLAILQPASGA